MRAELHERASHTAAWPHRRHRLRQVDGPRLLARTRRRRDLERRYRAQPAAGPPVVAEVGARFGPGVLGDDGIDRLALAAVVFRDDEALLWLEDLLHPHVKQVVAELGTEATVVAPPRRPLIAAEVPLLFETGMQTEFDCVLLVDGARRRAPAPRSRPSSPSQNFSAAPPAAQRGREGAAQRFRLRQHRHAAEHEGVRRRGLRDHDRRAPARRQRADKT